jgi:vancomycin resistance protein VanJ
LLRLLVLALVAASLVLIGAQQLGTDGPWWLELSRYLPLPLLLAPGIVALLLSLRLGRRWVAASAAAVLLFATVAAGFVWHAAGGREGAIRLMTYNAKATQALDRADGLAALQREVARDDPDIVVMQDAGALRHWRDANPKTPLFGFPHVFAEGQYVVASRLPLRGCATARVETGGEPMQYVHCTVDANDAAFELLTVHFESPRNGLNAARHEGFEGIESWRRNHDARLAQARALARVVGTRPIVLAGDLNAPESSSVVGNLLARGLRDAFASAGRGYGYTYGHTLRPAFSFLRIDHILVSPEIGVRDCFVGGSEASEHRPVIADLAPGRS